MGTRDSFDSAMHAIEGARFEVVDFMRFNEKSDIWNFIPHGHNFYELVFFLHGNAQISLGERSLYATFPYCFQLECVSKMSEAQFRRF